MSQLDAMAQHMWDARRARQNYANLPEALKPGSIAEAYEAQEVYHRLVEPVYGPVGGVKVATTTKVMQQLMGITHPCGGAIFARTIHASPARIAKSDFINLRIESEIALKLGQDMPAAKAPWTAESVVPFVAGAMPAYELIEGGETNEASAVCCGTCGVRHRRGHVRASRRVERHPRRTPARPRLSPGDHNGREEADRETRCGARPEGCEGGVVHHHLGRRD